jgi:NAD(P)-dependent dehydrogenase (short-subunit alcohol dehydrogenase family)
VTGAARGIGQAIAVGLAERGATVVIGDIGDLSQTVQLIAGTGGSPNLATLDISDPSAIETVRRRVADHAVTPPSETERGQLLRALASDAIRGGLERHFGVTLAFQNCHRVAAFRPSAVGGQRYRAFVSPRGQLLNQSPELRDC